MHMKMALKLTCVSNVISVLVKRTSFPCFRSCYELNRQFSTENHPVKPKKPLTAFFEFMRINRSDVLKDYPGIKMLEVPKVITEMWKELAPDEKQKFMDQAKERLQAYAVVYEQFLGNLSEEERTNMQLVARKQRQRIAKIRNKRELKRFGKPKKQLNAYNFFVREQSANKADPMNAAKLLPQKWKTLSDEERQVYSDKSARDLERYSQENALWVEEMRKLNREDLLPVPKVTKKLTKKKRRSASRKRMPAPEE